MFELSSEGHPANPSTRTDLPKKGGKKHITLIRVDRLKNKDAHVFLTLRLMKYYLINQAIGIESREVKALFKLKYLLIKPYNKNSIIMNIFMYL